jgi:hypothetical protein
MKTVAKYFRPLLFLLLLALSALPMLIARQPRLSAQASELHNGLGQQTQADNQLLEPGKPIEREFVAGQVHTYQIKLVAGQFLKLVVEQNNIDLYVVLSRADAAFEASSDVPTGPLGSETVCTIPAVTGTYKLQVTGKTEQSPGSYRIEIAELRAATDEDLRIALAGLDSFAGDGFKNINKDPAKAIEHYRAAQQLYLGHDQNIDVAHMQLKIGQPGQKGTELVFVVGDDKQIDAEKRNVQRPRVFYRRELEAKPLIVARR